MKRDFFGVPNSNSLVALAALGLGLCLLNVGCMSWNILPKWKITGDDDLARIDDVHGPLEKRLRGQRHAENNALGISAGSEEFQDAKAAYDDGDYKSAESQAKRIAKKYQDSPIREEALFLVAEAQFMQKKYSWAQDSYDKLLDDFPATRYDREATRHLFQIAKYWLQDPGYVSSNDIVPAHFEGNSTESVSQPKLVEKPKEKSLAGKWDLSRRIPIYPNVWDRTRPVFDTEGRALQALKTIWLKDVTGPLADDALMLSGSYHLRKGNYEEADRFFSILRQEFPKSEHIENAYVLGSHVKLAAYQGPHYDGRVLDDASKLKQNMLRQFPNHEDNDRVRDELRMIREAKAGQIWSDMKLYRKKGKMKAVRIYAQLLIDKYPETILADRARQLLNEMDDSENKPFRPSQEETAGRVTLTSPGLLDSRIDAEKIPNRPVRR